MSILDDFGSMLRTLRVYLLGRGLLSLAVFGTAAIASAMGVGVALPAAVMVLGGIGLGAYMRYRGQAQYEQGMVDLYRNDIADNLGIAPHEVSRAHLKQAAAGNEVIDQALRRQRHKSMVGFATSALAGIATFGLISAGLLEVGKELFSQLPVVGNLAQHISMGVVAAVSSLVLHDGLDQLIGRKTGLGKAAAHDRIVEMERGMARGWGISKEQVYGVLVAGNPPLQQDIERRFSKPYAAMKPSEQAHVLHAIGIAEDMQVVANEINQGRMRPSHLAYMMHEAVPRHRESTVAHAHASGKSFVQSLGFGRREEAGHVATLEAERARGLDQPRTLA